MDFGLARRERRGEEQLTHSGTVVGTPAYMSPEQIGGDPRRMGPASDVYSLGVIMYQMLAGQLPFRGSVGEVMSKILTETPAAPSELREGVDPHLEYICLRAMAKGPEDRYPSAGQLAAVLRDYLLGKTPTELDSDAITPPAGSDPLAGDFFDELVGHEQSRATLQSPLPEPILAEPVTGGPPPVPREGIR